MGLGVLEDKHLSQVPGTALLTDVIGPDHHHRHGGLDTSALRHAKGKDSDIVLVPQPSKSPNDPLNWPLWKKDLMLFFICIDTAVVGAWGPMITPGFVEMSQQFGVSYNTLNGDLGYGILLIGISCFFTNSMAVVWGRRPVFLLGNLLLFIGSIGGYYARSLGALLVFRLLGCIGMSPFEVLVTTTIADIYFVHQRGVRLAAWGLCLSIGVGGGTIISGYIIEDLGWNWTYGICAIMFGVWIVVLFLFCPETAYRRDHVPDTDHSTELGKADETAKESPKAKSGSESPGAGNAEVEIEIVEDAAPDGTRSEKKHTYWHDLKIFRGRVSDDPFWKVLTRPLLMLIFPQVLFSFLAYGLTTSWLVVVGSVLAQLFTAPPYNFSVSGVGLVSISSLVGAIVGAFTSGPIADWIVKTMSRRNGGIYEAEFRLVLIVISFVVGGLSFFGFGWSLQVQDHWIVPVVFYGLQYFGVGFMTIAVYGYLTDCHRDKAPEAFAAINLRNIYSFGMNYFISDWISTQGPKEVFCIIGGIHVFICLCAIPMYIFGKRCRSWTSRVKVFQKVMEA
ncbi:MFS general substrate transporter [Hypoxylon sp. FL1284]|nr:MFS general substrate transporter [Hypoxylon sp. FL1284]